MNTQMSTNSSRQNSTGGSVLPLFKYKIVFVGDQAVGKSCIINRFIYDIFDGTEHRPTIGIDFISHNIYLEEKTIRLQLWDTAGQDRFRSLIPSYIRGAAAAVLVYDVTSRDSFNSIDKWVRDIKQERDNDAVICLVGNKIDLPERIVSEKEGAQLAEKLGLYYMELSAKTGHNIQQLFKEIACRLPGIAASQISKTIPQVPPPEDDRIVINNRPSDKQSKTKKKCCS